jgi:polysaccharide biosynthesis PFTS motif protein
MLEIFENKLKYIINRVTKKRAFNVMRGYKILQQSDRIHQIESIKETLSTTQLFKNTTKHKIFKNVEGFSYELSVRQFILHHFCHRVSITNSFIGLTKALLICLGGNKRFIYPIPQQWQNIIENYKFSINRFASSFLWILAVLFFWTYGVFFLFRIIWEILNKKTCKSDNFSRVVFIKDLSVNDYLSYKNNPTNIITKALKDAPLNTLILHDNKQLLKYTLNCNKFQYSFLPILEPPNKKIIITYFLRSILLIIRSTGKLLLGKWEDSILLKELILANFINIIPKSSLPKLFLFDHSKFVYRPLWTYIVEKKEAKTILYFYSTNNESIILSKSIKRSNAKWSVMNWTNYWVWNVEQFDFVKQLTSFRNNITITGPILTGNILLNDKLNLPKKSVTVFDVQPQRDFKYSLFCEPSDYYIPSITNQFLDDIFDIVKSKKATMVYKGKRSIGKLAHYKHRIKMLEFSKEKEFMIIDSDISPAILCEVSNCVISFPFTSTSLIAKQYGKPTVYYDPTGKIDKLDPAAYGIQIISGRIELTQWLSKYLAT